MQRFQCVQFAAAAIASFGFILPSAALAVDPGRSLGVSTAAESSSALDVSLGESGKLSGQVLNGQGAPVAESTVSILAAGNEVASAITDTEGRFTIADLQGGVFEANVEQTSQVFRLWTANAGPPSAKPGILIVTGDSVNRGQCCQRRCCPRRPYAGRLTNGQVVFGALLITGVTGAVIAVSLSNQAQPSGS